MVGKRAASAYSAGELQILLSVHAIAIEAMAQGICVLDSDFRIVLYNRGFLESTKVSPQPVQIGTPFRDLFQDSPDESNPTALKKWQDVERLLKSGEPFRLQRKFAGDKIITLYFQPITGGGWVVTSERSAQDHNLELQDEHGLLFHVLQYASIGMCVYDAARNIVTCNDEYRRIYGCDPARDTFDDLLCDTRMTSKRPLSDGRVVEVRAIPLETGGWLTEHEEAVPKRRLDQALQDRNRLLDTALDHMAHGLCAYDSQFRVIVVNQRYLETYRLKPEEAKFGTPMVELMRRSIERGVHASTNAEAMFADLKERLIKNKEPVLVRHLANGRVIAVRHQPMGDGGWVGTYEDITERHNAQENISRMARHDALTALPNRLMLQERMIEGLTSVACDNGHMAVMCFDLDNFKAINDSLGHPFGDKLLKAMAERLRAVVDERDTLARLGGDEFAILHPSADAEEARDLGNRLVASASAPFLIEGQEINPSICVGIAVAPENGTTGEELMKRADLALYRAKSAGRGTVAFFHPEMDRQVQARRAIEVDLRHAISSGSLDVAYQPQMKLSTGEIVGMEALVRWTHPERGPIPPAEFIPVAEETGLIAPLGELVLRRACAEAVHWPASITLAVNLSPVQFRNRGLVSVIMNILASTQFPARRLDLEITEAVLMQKNQAVMDMLHQLRTLGVRITMDDFGTGYSSLSYLRRFPFDKIKIDRSFVADIGTSESATAIIQTIAALGSAMRIETTAEGVETPEQLTLLRLVGCTEVQGYLIGRPSPAREARRFIQQSQRKTATG